MFCYQCEQTAKGTGCTKVGVCGKDENTAAMQDLLIHALKGLSNYAARAQKLGVTDRETDHFTIKGLFSTLTNVDFDAEKLAGLVREAAARIETMRKAYEDACSKSGVQPEALHCAAGFQPAGSLEGMVEQGKATGIEKRKAKLGEDVAGLQELITYGLKGIAAYADHAMILGKDSDEVYAFIYEALDFLTKENPTLDELLGCALKVGEINLKVMELLDSANTGTYGHPVPTAVRVSPVKGKCILVSGHDLKDLEELLKQTEGKGINIYTHGEMLPAHGYPELKKYQHLAGNYGGAWQDQKDEFDKFPGAILMTTNCIQKPKDSYIGRIFTSGVVEWPGVKHISGYDFSPVIEAALAAEGFAEDAPEKTIMTGFARNAVLGVADKVIGAVKEGKIKHFFLIGGCDGAKSGRNYYTDLAKAVPEDCMILTLACGKYRFNHLDLGTIDGLPRLLDIGQCNDAYSAIQIAVALAGAFDCTVNDLPLSMVLSWYEQKAVSILLTLLYLGIKDIRLGPSLPAFVTPAALGILVEKFGIKPITTVEADLAAILSKN